MGVLQNSLLRSRWGGCCPLPVRVLPQGMGLLLGGVSVLHGIILKPLRMLSWLHKMVAVRSVLFWLKEANTAKFEVSAALIGIAVRSLDIFLIFVSNIRVCLWISRLTSV